MLQMQKVYLGEIKRQVRRRLHGWTYVEDYEPGRAEYLERLRSSEWSLDEFVLGERNELYHPTVAAYIDGEVTSDIPRLRWATLRKLTEVVAAWQPDSVTEVGAGTGRNLIWLASELGITGRGVELSPSGAAAGNLAASRFGLDVELVAGDITDPATPIPPADVVISVHALEQIPYPADVVRRMVAAARTAVIMYEPFPEFWPGGLGRLAHTLRNSERLKRGSIDGHDYEVERLSFGTALNRASIVTIRCAP